MRHALGAPPGIGCQNRLGIGPGAKAPGRTELVHELEVIVDLAVIRDHRAVWGRHRLLTCGRQVDDGKASVCETADGARRLPEAMAVGPAVSKERPHGAEHMAKAANRRPRERKSAGYSTHARLRQWIGF